MKLEGGNVLGVGVDLTEVARIRSAHEKHGASFLDKIFTPAEQRLCLAKADPYPSLAARFAAKEAVAKVLGDTQGLEWHHCEVVTDSIGKPSLQITGTVAEVARARGIASWHLSLSHDGGHAIAFVVAEGSSHA